MSARRNHLASASSLRTALLLGSALACVACAPKRGGTTGPFDDASCSQSLEPVALQKRTRSSVVRIIAHETLAGRDSSGSGFVLADGSDDQLSIVTNYHVVAGADSFEVVLNQEGTAMTLAGAEVVKVDPKRDLALLRAARPPHFDGGLRVHSGSPDAGQRVAVMGYPGIGSEFSITFEEGAISNPKLTQDGMSYVATNANINPGNSGGPMLDACGRSVGVVVAKVTTTDRIGLAIPTGDLLALYDRFTTPRQPVANEVGARLDGFFQALKFNDSMGAAGHVSHEFLASRLAPLYREFEQKVVAIEQQRHADPTRSSLEDYLMVVGAELPKEEHGQLVASLLFRGGQINAYQALELFLAPYLQVMFGSIEQATYDVRADSETQATVLATTVTGGQTVKWTIGMKYERGDWFIDSLANDREATTAAVQESPFEHWKAGRLDDVLRVCSLPEEFTQADYESWRGLGCPTVLAATHFVTKQVGKSVQLLNVYCNLSENRSNAAHRSDTIAGTLILVYGWWRRELDAKKAWTRLQDPIESFASACQLRTKDVKQSTKTTVDQLERAMAGR